MIQTALGYGQGSFRFFFLAHDIWKEIKAILACRAAQLRSIHNVDTDTAGRTTRPHSGSQRAAGKHEWPWKKEPPIMATLVNDPYCWPIIHANSTVVDDLLWLGLA